MPWTELPSLKYEPIENSFLDGVYSFDDHDLLALIFLTHSLVHGEDYGMYEHMSPSLGKNVNQVVAARIYAVADYFKQTQVARQKWYDVLTDAITNPRITIFKYVGAIVDGPYEKVEDKYSKEKSHRNYNGPEKFNDQKHLLIPNQELSSILGNDDEEPLTSGLRDQIHMQTLGAIICSQSRLPWTNGEKDVLKNILIRTLKSKPGVVNINWESVAAEMKGFFLEYRQCAGETLAKGATNGKLHTLKEHRMGFDRNGSAIQTQAYRTPEIATLLKARETQQPQRQPEQSPNLFEQLGATSTLIFTAHAETTAPYEMLLPIQRTIQHRTKKRRTEMVNADTEGEGEMEMKERYRSEPLPPKKAYPNSTHSSCVQASSTCSC